MPERPLPTNPADADSPASPCIRNCCLDDNDICLGCFRSVEEIVRWGSADQDERHAILKRASARRPA